MPNILVSLVLQTVFLHCALGSTVFESFRCFPFLLAYNLHTYRFYISLVVSMHPGQYCKVDTDAPPKNSSTSEDKVSLDIVECGPPKAALLKDPVVGRVFDRRTAILVHCAFNTNDLTSSHKYRSGIAQTCYLFPVRIDCHMKDIKHCTPLSTLFGFPVSALLVLGR